MEKIVEKLEKIISNYLDDLEVKPIKTLIVSLAIYYIFRKFLKK